MKPAHWILIFSLSFTFSPVVLGPAPLGSIAMAVDRAVTTTRPPVDGPSAKKPTKPGKIDPLILEFMKVWAKTTTFEAEFQQTKHYPAMEETEKTSGRVWVTKPGRLRWDETTPSQKTSQILNGKKLSSITERLKKPGFRTIDVWENGLALLDRAAFSFLSESGNLTESYDITLQKNETNAAFLVLKPKGKTGDPLVAEITKPGYVLRALSSETPESRVRIDFSKVKTNEKIEDSVFEWAEDKDKDRVHVHKAK
jgi:outer membrane lipoprotein carrier protein